MLTKFFHFKQNGICLYLSKKNSISTVRVFASHPMLATLLDKSVLCRQLFGVTFKTEHPFTRLNFEKRTLFAVSRCVSGSAVFCQQMASIATAAAEVDTTTNGFA